MLKVHSSLSDHAILALRLVVGAVFLYHGLMKWGFFTGGAIAMPSDPLFAVLAFVEPVMGLLLVLGLFVPAAAMVLSVVMVGAIFFKLTGRFPNSTLFSAWEFDLLLLAANFVFITHGGGKYALHKS